MEIITAFNVIDKQLEEINKATGFKKDKKSDDKTLVYSGDKGAYKLTYDEENSIFAFDCAYDPQADSADFNTVSKSLFNMEEYDERDAKSFANEVADEVASLYKTKKKADLNKVKMPKAVSRTKAKNGVISYDVDSLANRFGVLFPESKDLIKQNIIDYGEFLPETFFIEHGTQTVIDVIKNGNDAERKRLFKMLNEVYEDGTNEVQDVIGVTILGAMKNDKAMMAVADEYMSEYMSGPVHEINKITAKNNKMTKKLANPPAYKPKKKKMNIMESALQAQSDR